MAELWTCDTEQGKLWFISKLCGVPDARSVTRIRRLSLLDEVT